MSLVDELSLRQRAEQLGCPSGEVGLAVAEQLSSVNREGNMLALRHLKLERGDRVLEIGCGLGEMAAAVHKEVDGVEYFGLDLSETMIDAARDRHLGLIGAGGTSFHLGQAERMAFEDAFFSKILSIGVIHFWKDPSRALAEMARVMRPGARMSLACLGPERAPPFALAQYGFHLHDAGCWERWCREAGLVEVEVQISSLAGPDSPQAYYISASR